VAGSKDAKLRAAQAEEAAAKATKEGIAGIGKSMTAIGGAVPLFGGGDLDLQMAQGSVLPENELDESKMSLIDERYEGGGFDFLESLGLGKPR